MDRITMKSTAAGPNGTFPEGRTFHVPAEMSADFAESLVAAGAAVESPPLPRKDAPAETSTAPAPENARAPKAPRAPRGGA